MTKNRTIIDNNRVKKKKKHYSYHEEFLHFLICNVQHSEYSRFYDVQSDQIIQMKNARNV